MKRNKEIMEKLHAIKEKQKKEVKTKKEKPQRMTKLDFHSNIKTQVETELSCEKGVIFDDGYHKVTMNPKIKLGVLILSEHNQDKTLFKDVFLKTDLEYQISDKGIKENIIIKEKQEEYEFPFVFHLKNLKIKQNSKEVLFIDKENSKTILKMPRLFMVDSHGIESKEVKFSLQVTDDSITMTILPDKKWLNDESRVFPVLVDPTLEYDLPKVIDFERYNGSTIVSDEANTFSVGKLESIYNRLKIVINAKSIAETLKEIDNFKCYLKLHYIEGKRLASSPGFAVAQYGTPYGLIFTEELLNETEGNINIDVTSCINDYINNPVSSNEEFEIYFQLIDTQIKSSVALYETGTTNPSTTDDYIIVTLKDLKDGHEPQIVVDYPSNNIFSKSNSVKEFDSGKAGKTFLNLFNLNMLHEHEDLSINHNQLNINVSHIYLPKLFDLGTETHNKEKYMGKGWKTNLHQYIVKNPNYNYLLGSKEITYIDGYGEEHQFFEKWYYEKDNEKFYVDKNNIFIDADGKAKIKDANEFREVKFECVSDEEDLTFIPGSSLSNFHSHMDFEDDYSMYIEFADGYRKTIFLLPEGKVLVPIYYLLSGTQKIYQDYSNINYGDGNNITHINGTPMILEKTEKKELNFDEKGFYFEYMTYDGIKKIYPIPTMSYLSPGTRVEDIYLNEDIQQIDSELDQLESNFISYAKQLRELKESTGMIDYQNQLKISWNIESLESKVKKARDKLAEKNDEQQAYNTASDNLENAQKNVSKYIENKQREMGYSQFNNNIYDFIKSKVRLFELKEKRKALVEQQLKEVNDILVDNEGNTLGFDGYGRLILLSDAQENSITIQYGEKEEENKILLISSDTETLKFNYDLKTGLLKNMIDHQGRKLKFDYSNGVLTKIIYPNLDVSLFEEKFSVTNPLGHYYKFRFLNNRVKSFTEEMKKNKISKDGIQEEENTIILGGTTIAHPTSSYTTILKSNICKDKSYYFDSLGNILEFEDNETKNHEYRYFENDNLIFNVTSNENQTLSTQTEKTGTITLIKGNAPASNMAILKCTFSKMNIDRLDYAEIFFEATIEDCRQTKKFKQRFIEYVHTNVILPICFDHKDQVKITYKIAFSQDITIESISLFEANGEIYQYDVDNNCIQMQSGIAITTYEDFDGKKPTKIALNDGYNDCKISRFSYNNDENLTLKEDHLGNVVEYTYNGKNLIKEKSYNKYHPSLSTETEYQYDEKGNLIQEENENSIFQTIDRNTNELIGLCGTHNGQPNPTTFMYTKGLLTTLKNQNTTYHYEYDALGRKTKIVVDGKTLMQQYFFDKEMKKNSKNQQRSIVDFGDNYGIQTIKDMSDHLIKISKGNITGTEDEMSLEEEDISAYTYDNKNRITKIAHNHPSKQVNVIEQYTYDENDDLIQKTRTGSEDLKVNYTYDNQHRLLSEQYTLDSGTNFFTTELEYDSFNKENISKVKLFNNNEIHYKYDAFNRISKQTIISSQNELIDYEFKYIVKDKNTLDLINQHQIKINGKLEDCVDYTYDDYGNITTIITDMFQIRYHYDSLNRLIREDNEPLQKTTTFQYDSNGNRIRKKEYPFTLKEQLLDCSLIETYQYDKNQLISIKNQTKTSTPTTQEIKYSENDKFYGYPIQYKGYTLTWNKHKELESFGNIQYKYNEQGIRISKTIGTITTEYVVDGTKILSSIANDGKTFYFHYAVDKLIGFKYNNNEYIYRRNIQGDITHIYTKEGLLVAEYQYDAWGNCNIINYSDDDIGNLNPFRYRGYFFDTETQLYYLNSRYYDSKTGRFISPDVLSILDETMTQINGLNLYMYCGNNPINKYDPTGHFPWLILAAAVLLFTPVGGIVFQAATSILSYAVMSIWALGDLVFNGGKGAWSDMCRIKWNPFNTDESATLNSSKVSFYKGVPVFQISGRGGSMSLGAIFFDKKQGEKVLKHEWGHNIQLMAMGLVNFLIQVGIPSIWKNGDETPWELSASILGGSTLADDYSSKQKQQALKYFIRSMLPIINIYNIFQYLFY